MVLTSWPAHSLYASTTRRSSQRRRPAVFSCRWQRSPCLLFQPAPVTVKRVSHGKYMALCLEGDLLTRDAHNPDSRKHALPSTIPLWSCFIVFCATYRTLCSRFSNVSVMNVMTFKRELERVDCQSALFSLTRGVCGHHLDVPLHWVFAVINEMFRITPNVFRSSRSSLFFKKKQKGHDTESY